jgi:dienelactone hydrolase
MMANIPGAVADPSVEIHLRSGTDDIPGYLAPPAQPGSYPGLVAIHEALGLIDQTGYVAL